jgi:hypothetical protein
MRSRLLLLSLAADLTWALNPLQKLLVEGELKRRPEWVDGGVQQAAPRVWRWVAADDDVVLALPELSGPETRRLAASLESAGALVDTGATRRISTLTKHRALAPSPFINEPAAAECKRRTEAFVERVLVGLRQCPFTASKDKAGVGLEEMGVRGAPILYAHSRCTTSSQLVSDVWRTLDMFLAGGEAVYSSVLLTAPAFDDDVEKWIEKVFPLLEEALVAAQLSRDVGIVCFHPDYRTPDGAWLATHRFGHMYAPSTLRSYCADAGAGDLADLADDDFFYYGSYMRRAPHATINVLWSRQLKAAEAKRESAQFYARNLRRLKSEGRGALEAAAAAERTVSL